LALDTATIEVRISINQPPVVGEFSPADGHTITEGDTLNISVAATDPNAGDVLQYRYYINGTVKEDWTAEPSYNYALTAADAGLNRIKAEITDGQKTVQTQEVEIYVFRKSPILP
jgi:hypothetical protein